MLSSKTELASASANNHKVLQDPAYLCSLQEYHLYTGPPYDRPDNASSASPFRNCQSLLLSIPFLGSSQLQLLGVEGGKGRIETSPTCFGHSNVSKGMSYSGTIALQSFSELLICQASKSRQKSDHGILCLFFPPRIHS